MEKRKVRAYLLLAWAVTVLLAGCSSPTEPEPEIGLFMHGQLTSKYNRIEYDWDRAVITVRCEDCEDGIVRIKVREDGSYGARVPNPNRHFGHHVKATLWCPIVESGAVEIREHWDSFPKTPVEWNPELK